MKKSILLVIFILSLYSITANSFFITNNHTFKFFIVLMVSLSNKTSSVGLVRGTLNEEDSKGSYYAFSKPATNSGIDEPDRNLPPNSTSSQRQESSSTNNNRRIKVEIPYFDNSTGSNDNYNHPINQNSNRNPPHHSEGSDELDMSETHGIDVPDSRCPKSSKQN